MIEWKKTSYEISMNPETSEVVQAQIQGVESWNTHRLGNYGGMECGYENHNLRTGSLGQHM